MTWDSPGSLYAINSFVCVLLPGYCFINTVSPVHYDTERVRVTPFTTTPFTSCISKYTHTHLQSDTDTNSVHSKSSWNESNLSDDATLTLWSLWNIHITNQMHVTLVSKLPNWNVCQSCGMLLVIFCSKVKLKCFPALPEENNNVNDMIYITMTTQSTKHGYGLCIMYYCIYSLYILIRFILDENGNCIKDVVTFYTPSQYNTHKKQCVWESQWKTVVKLFHQVKITRNDALCFRVFFSVCFGIVCIA